MPVRLLPLLDRLLLRHHRIMIIIPNIEIPRRLPLMELNGLRGRDVAVGRAIRNALGAPLRRAFEVEDCGEGDEEEAAEADADADCGLFRDGKGVSRGDEEEGEVEKGRGEAGMRRHG